ncbi:PDZ domain-containing protein [Antarcticibacterium arcticum]|uniref:PDZ domain-containing protein n=1 Tax=Antarcticibacterium arcticum TaxID=2585771 RepID=A0A5B8YGQ5_9FLAO|nr:aspartyl protease family protein [Antarcticibacterium arcticum]QED36288.1 PDZ domain-containing protein [Antarcticibacterium arcticum]
MKKLKAVYFFFLFSIFFLNSARAQPRFIIENNKDKFDLRFELVNDLVIIPLEINGVELSFLLDTGVDSTILFSIGDNDTVNLKNTETIYLRGLGEGEPIKALKSSGNEVKIGQAVNKNLSCYLVFDNPLSLSNRMGVPIHGIIGYDLFRDFVISFNYLKMELTAYDPRHFTYPNCRKCDDLPLTFVKNKPYINISGRIEGESIPLNLLVDSGSGDAVWLFSKENDGIVIPENNFTDFLGFGIGGSVYGKRSRIKEIHFGNNVLREVTASFPDTVYFKGIETFAQRNGSIGAQILKRFNVIIDYPGKKMRLKPNKTFSEPFEYDMSGVVIAHDGFSIIKDIMRNPLSLREDDVNNTAAGNMVYKSTYEVKYSLEPQYKVAELRPDSPASLAGLKVGDIILKINRRDAYKFTLSQISYLLSSREGKSVNFLIERDGVERKISFVLKRIL